MRIRDAAWKHYGITKRERNIVEKFCTNPCERDKEIILNVAKSVNPIIAKEIYNSLVLGQSYTKQTARKYIPLGEKDFYGYRRKVVYELYKTIISAKSINHDTT